MGHLRRGVVAFAVSAALVPQLVACGLAKTQAPPAPASPSTDSTAGSSPSASTDDLQIVPPRLDPGVTALFSVEAQSGGRSVAIPAQAGTVWILIGRVGGDISIDIRDVATLPFGCADSTVSQFGNQIDVTSAQTLTVSFQPASGDVRWSAVIGE